jgi:CRP-like cAMP-binding protein
MNVPKEILEKSVIEGKPLIFKYLKKEDINLIDSRKQEVEFEPGEKILKQGAPFAYIVFLLTGAAKIHFKGIYGKDLILRILRPLEFFVGPGLHVDDQYAYSLTALEPSMVYMIEKATFMEIMKKNHEFLHAFLVDAHSHLLHAFQKLITLNQKNARGRVAEALLYLSDEVFGSDEFDSLLTKVEFSDLAGVSKETVYKIFNEFDRDKLIKVDGESHYKILEIQMLKKISEKG